MQFHKTSRQITAVACLFVSIGVLGLESDKDQDILYSSAGRSTSRMDGDVRIITLEQDVNVTQGTMHIEGDNAVFESEAGSSTIRRVTVSGSPARYRQQLNQDGEFVDGESESIFYFVEGEPIIELVGSAILRSTNNVLSCAAIRYYTDSGFTETTGPCEGVSGRAPTADSAAN